MKKCLNFNIIHIYLFIILIKSIFNILFKRIEQIDEIIYIYPKTANKIYYFTLKSSYEIENDINKIIKKNVFSFTSLTDITLLNESEELFFASCTIDHYAIIFHLNGTIIDSRQYSTSYPKNTTYKCPIHYYSSNSKFFIGLTYYINTDNNMKSTCNQISINNKRFLGSMIYSTLNSIGNYLKIDLIKPYECFYINDNVIKIFKTNEGLNSSQNYLIQATDSEFEVATNNINEAIVYYFDEKLKIEYINGTDLHYNFILETQNTFDFKVLVISEIINDDNDKRFLCVYKSNINNNLFIETYILINDEFEIENYYQIKNKIGISKIFLKQFSDNSNYFILLRGDQYNKNKYEYFSKEDLDTFQKTKLNECISSQNNLLTPSKTNIKIKISDIYNNLSSNDEIIFYPNNLNYKYLDDEYIEIIIDKENGKIKFNTGLKIAYNEEYEIKFTRIYQCMYIINICNQACSYCTEVQNENKSPTKCSPKRCNEGFYYKINDETECVKSTINCYETCNTCSEIGNNIEHKCESCKFGYVLHGSNCIICDKNKKYWYYDPIINFNECLYEDNYCPINFPILVKSTNECISQCPFGFYLNDENECIEQYYYINNNKKIILNNDGCGSNYQYILYESKECLKKCSNNNYYLISNSNFCIDKCEKVNLILNNGKCICLLGNIKINSNNQIICEITNEKDQKYPIIDLSSAHSFQEAILLIEGKLDILKQLDIILEYEGFKFEVLNSSIIKGLDSNNHLGSIDLGECETILKKYYNLNTLLPLITLLINSESKSDSLVNTLNYYVYSQNGEKLDLSLCSDIKISVYNSILDNSTVNINLINLLVEEGINLFDINDIFYQDRCFPFGLNGNDVTLNDRIKDLYSNISICESKCEFLEYNEINKRIECNCYVKNKFEETIKKKQNSNIFKSINNRLNYELFKCYPIFRYFKKKFYKNIGFWFYLVILSNILIGLLIYLFYLKNKFCSEVYNNFKKAKINKKKRRALYYIPKIFNPPKRKNIKEESSFSTKNLNSEQQTYHLFNYDNIQLNKIKIKDSFQLNDNEKSRNIKNINLLNNPSHIKSSSRGILTTFEQNNYSDSKSFSMKNDKNTDYIQFEKSLFSKVNNIVKYKKKRDIIIVGKNKIKKNQIDFREKLKLKYSKAFKKNKDYINNFWNISFNNAIHDDNKLFFNSLYSFFFVKLELIAILFFPEAFDYYIITIPLYLLSLFMDLTINALIYTDKIISQKYYNKGKLNFITELILAFISNIITSLIIKYLKKEIAYSYVLESLRYEKKNEIRYNKFVRIFMKIINRRIILNFIYEIILCSLCGYYLYIFCEVYHRSQISLLINFLISLGTSIAIVLCITIIVCILRYIGLKCKKKYIYYSSRYISQLI